MSKECFVEIVKYADGDAEEEVVKRMGPSSQHRAEKIERGADINLDHENYFTRVVDADGNPVE
jgi:hypothetical protein